MYNESMRISSFLFNINSYQSSKQLINTRAEEETREEAKAVEQTPSNKEITELTINERQKLSRLQQRDSQVRAHEATHIAAGGSVVSVGGASFVYQEGPDGKLYAIGIAASASMVEARARRDDIRVGR